MNAATWLGWDKIPAWLLTISTVCACARAAISRCWGVGARIGCVRGNVACGRFFQR
jgi:hypothetical protein